MIKHNFAKSLAGLGICTETIRRHSTQTNCLSLSLSQRSGIPLYYTKTMVGWSSPSVLMSGQHNDMDCLLSVKEFGSDRPDT